MTAVALVGPVSPNLAHLQALMAAGKVDKVMAIDGGYRYLADAGIPCATVVGDFDSLGYLPQGVETVQLPTRKDKLDAEEAIAHAVGQGATRLYLYGVLGGRADMMLASLQLLGMCGENKLDVVSIGDDQAVIPMNGEGRNRVDVTADARGTFSLLAMNDVVYGVTEQGVEYELQDAFLYINQVLGVSNEFIGKPAYISINRGGALLFVPLDVLPFIAY